ncbi:MAG: glycosyltransferase [Actinomycetes bacterium]
MTAGPTFDHLASLSTPLGLYEHARYAEPRIQHGFCLDDVARGLVVTAREPHANAQVRQLADSYLSFVLASVYDDGRMHNRRNATGMWTDAASTDDHWGRALWSLGVASCVTDDPSFVQRAREGASKAMKSRSRYSRSMAYAALGAAAILRMDPSDLPAQRLLVDARPALGMRRNNAAWPWPEDRLTYANAVIPEAMIVTGEALNDEVLQRDGLVLLEWLADLQQQDGHLSVIPSAGFAAGDPQPGYAQQPIEVAALAEACRAAYVRTGEARWRKTIAQCLAWFEGANDVGVRMYDEVTGGGLDGLERGSANQNQGAESTLAWLSTQQIALMPQLTGAL